MEERQRPGNSRRKSLGTLGFSSLCWGRGFGVGVRVRGTPFSQLLSSNSLFFKLSRFRIMGHRMHCARCNKEGAPRGFSSFPVRAPWPRSRPHCAGVTGSSA